MKLVQEKLGIMIRAVLRDKGKGNFRPTAGANPFIGEIGKLEAVNETRIEVVVPQHLEGDVMNALFKNHPYEELLILVISLNNQNNYIGIGMIGELRK